MNKIFALNLHHLSLFSCSDVNKIREGIGDKIAGFLQWTSACICGMVMGLAYGWKLALVIIAVSPLLILCGLIMAKVRSLQDLSLVYFLTDSDVSLGSTVKCFHGKHCISIGYLNYC